MNVVVSYVDTAMVGALGANASAAVGLTSTVGWLVSSIAIAFGIGILSVCAQAIGAKDEKSTKNGSTSIVFNFDCRDCFNSYLCYYCPIFTSMAKW